MIKNGLYQCKVMLFFITLFVVLASFYFQYVQHIDPCPLCLMQRLCAILLLVLSGLNFVNISQRKKQWFLTFAVFITLAGLYFVGRQLWLQSLPPGNIPACMPGLDVLMQYFPWQTVAHALFLGDGDCATQTWTFLGFSMAFWSGIYFLFAFLSNIFLLWKLKK